MEANGIKTIVCSHTATPYHQITTFLPMEGQYAIQSVIRSEEVF